jgi:hypothetical protein
MGVLRWGEMVYRRSNGERGWSIGVAIYQLFGWDAEAYEEDFGHVGRLTDDNADSTADCAETEAVFWHHRGRRLGGRMGHRGGPRFLAGLGCLAFLSLLLIVPGVILYRRWRDTRDSTAASGETPDSGSAA